MFAALVFRPRLDISVLRDRAPLFVALSNGDIRNGYTFKISNMTRERKDYGLTFSGVADADISVVGLEGEEHVKPELSAKPDTVTTYRIYVRAPASVVKGGLDAAEVRAEGPARRRDRHSTTRCSWRRKALVTEVRKCRPCTARLALSRSRRGDLGTFCLLAKS